MYLDDIVIFSETLEEHITHCQMVIDALEKDKFYVGKDKLNFLADKLNLLGHVIQNGGIQMDPCKVDRIENWKIPTSKQLLMEFLGAVGFLAPGAASIRIPMAVLHRRVGKNASWHWTETKQHAFKEVKSLVGRWSKVTHCPLDYSPNFP